MSQDHTELYEHDLEEATGHSEETPGTNNELKLIRMEALNLNDGMEIDKEMWKPLFGGDLIPLWDSILEHPGDKVILQGSSVTKMVFGVYAVDTTTGLAAKDLRADVDILIDQPAIQERLEHSKFVEGHTYAATKLKVGGLEIGSVTLERLRALDLETLEDLDTWLQTVEDAKLRDRYTLIADRLRTQTASGDLHTFMTTHHLLPPESMGIELERGTDGELHAYFLDGAHMMDDWFVRSGLFKSEQAGVYYGVAYPGPNMSVRALMLDAMQHMNDAEFRNTVPLYAVQNISRTALKMPAEMDVEMLEENDGFYSILWQVAKRLSDGEKIFHMTEPSVEQLNMDEWMTRTVQADFAKSCATNSFVACTRVFGEMPLGKFISPELGDYFQPVYEYIGPDSTFGRTLVFIATPEAELPPLPTPQPDQKRAPEQELRTLIRISEANTRNYGFKIAELEAVADLGYPTESLEFPDDERPSRNMSETYAILFWAMKLDPKRDAAKIDRILHDWKQTGMLTTTWKTKKLEFDTGVNKELVVDYMQKLYDGKLITEYA